MIMITRSKVINNRDVLYLFGDNLIRKGLGGQAKEMRGEPNTVGIITKKYPSNKEGSFFTDSDYEQYRLILEKDIEEVIRRLNRGEYRALVIPPIGIGLARLEDKAPKCWQLLQESVRELVAEVCTRLNIAVYEI